MHEMYAPGKKSSYVRKPCPLTKSELEWLKTRELRTQYGGDYYCYWCEWLRETPDGAIDCICDEDNNCPICTSVEALEDGMEFMGRVLYDIMEGDEHDKPCSHLPKNLSCPYQSDQYGDKPCYWCDHKERLLRIEESLDGAGSV